MVIDEELMEGKVILFGWFNFKIWVLVFLVYGKCEIVVVINLN